MDTTIRMGSLRDKLIAKSKEADAQAKKAAKGRKPARPLKVESKPRKRNK